MIILTTRVGAHTIRTYLNRAGDAAQAVELVCYEDLRPDRSHAPGLYVFADLERLTPPIKERALSFRRELDKEQGATCLNHPGAWVDRVDYLRTLHEAGINDFASHPLGAGVLKARYPVFLRHRWNHTGALTGLARNPIELVLRVLRATLRSPTHPRDLVVTEFSPTADANGLYRKYSAFRVGKRIIPRHLFFSRRWMVKTPALLDPELLAEEAEYLRTNPHEDMLSPLFEMSNVEWGRIDYAFDGHRIRVWEINTNPMIVPTGDWGARSEVQLLFLDRLHEAFEAILLK